MLTGERQECALQADLNGDVVDAGECADLSGDAVDAGGYAYQLGTGNVFYTV